MEPWIIGIAGGTGSGKTTIAGKLAAAARETVAIIEYDAYYRDRPDLSYDERTELNFDHPDALETSLLIHHLDRLKALEPVKVPIYDFKTHCRRLETRRVMPTPVIIVEGILTFVDPELRRRFDLKVFVDTDADIRAFRRIRRDIEERGRSFQSIRDQYYSTVRPMHLQFVEPSKRWADVIIPEGGESGLGVDLLAQKIRSLVPPPL